MAEIVSVFDPLPPQRAFLGSKAKIRGYGGAMGGGKSRTGCEQIFDYALDYPGLMALVARQAHTSIVETTKKTMLDQVIPFQLYESGVGRSRSSAGVDMVELFNGSQIHFIGLEDPTRWYSSEIGAIFFDECQEIEEDTVLRLLTRLRQQNMPNKAILTFNPGNPGHWLQNWFINGAERTEFGLYKPELWMEGATHPLGDAEFFFARAIDNPYLPDGYVDQTLSGLKQWQRRRYLEGLWEFISGKCFFDVDALREYELAARDQPPLFNGTTRGEITADMLHRVGRGPKPQGSDKVRVDRGDGPLTVWKAPARRHDDEASGKIIEAHRYVLAIDASSGRGRDWSALEVIDVDDFEQVAEMQVKLETGLVAEQAYRLGRIYNDALIIPELQGGWGLAVEQVLKRFRYPRIYTRRTFDRLSQRFTDRTGWDTTVRTRGLILEALETAIREREFGLYSLRALAELGTFVWNEDEKAEAQPGCNDDMVMALAIGVYVAGTMPRQLKRAPERPHVPQFAVTGY
jgi:hypothetical protein